MTTTAATRIVANPDLTAGDRIATPDGWVTLEGDAVASSRAPEMVCVDVAAGTLYLAAEQSSRVLDQDLHDEPLLDETYLESKGYSSADIELFALGLALGQGRAAGLTDAATIHRFCLADPDDVDRLLTYTGHTDPRQLQPTTDTALDFIQSYRD